MMKKTSDKDFLAKAMSRGSQVSGPEPFGCFNSGLKPIICQLKGGAYVVGLENDCVDVWEGRLRLAIQLGRKTRRVYHTDRGRQVWYIKTAKAAKKRFLSLVDGREAENRQTGEKVAGLREKAGAGDLAAVCELGNYV